MRIAVIGAGGVGGYFGARLAGAGNEVTFVARGRHLDAIRRSGLRVRSPLGEFTTPAASAVGSIAELGPTDLVIVAVKLWDTEDVAAQLSAAAGLHNPYVLSLQNGVHKDIILRSRLGNERVLGGTCFISAFIEEPGVVVHNNELQKIIVGPYSNEQSAMSEAVYGVLKDAGIETELSSDVEKVVWEKFIFLVGLSATTTTVRQPIGVVRSNDRTRVLLHDVMAETAEVARACGVKLDDTFVEAQMEFCDHLPAGMTSSMHNDLEKGHRLELPWLSGGVVDLAENLNVAVPRNRTVTDILAPYAAGSPRTQDARS